MYRIRTFDKISPRGLAKFPIENYEISSDTTSPSAIILRSYKLNEFEFPESTLAVARAGAGYDNVPVDRCTEKGIAAFNTPGANANAVAELVIAALLMTSRRLVQGSLFCQSLKNGDASKVAALAEKGKKDFGGQELSGKTLGLIGLGAIGGRVANAAIAMGMTVIGFDPWLSVDNALQLPRDVTKTDYLSEIYAKSDYISVHVPLADGTRSLLNDDTLAQCKNQLRLLNFSRNGIIDNAAALRAIESGKVAYYATDFTQPELLGNDRVLCFPHLGASTEEAEENCAFMAADQLRSYLEHGNVVNSVNLPCVVVPRTTKHRITLITKNVPNMVARISSVLGKHSINISDLTNKSRGDIAYNILDLDSEPSDDIYQALQACEGVIKVRFIN